MKRYFTDIIKSVRVVLDQNKDSSMLSAIGDVDTLSIDEIIEESIHSALHAVLMAAPDTFFDSGIDMAPGDLDVTMKDTQDGHFSYASIKLPSNFIRLLALKMNDWDFAVSSASPRGSATYAVQHSRVGHIHGNPQNPVAVITPDGKHVEAFSSNSMAALDTFVYVGMPDEETINGKKCIEISDNMYESFIYYSASLVCATLSDFDKSKALRDIAMQHLTTKPIPDDTVE